ncbi:MAG: DUF2007 domain-containing protein [Anaerolineae bacterium]|nr:DUF2007 domain-containing protein [Anaerolineae bacterium]
MTLPSKPGNPDSHDSGGKPQREQPVWMVVATTGGVTEAAIIAERLKSLGIPAFIDRESLGAVLGLTVGMGQARVVVPEPFYDAAMAVLEPDPDIPWLGDGDEDDAFDDLDESDDEDGAFNPEGRQQP